MAYDFSAATVHHWIGDINASDHGGGIVLTDKYGTRIFYTHGAGTDAPDFDPYDDAADPDACELEVYIVDVPDSAEAFTSEWYFKHLAAACKTCSQDFAEVLASLGTMEGRASALEILASHLGWRELDPEPCTWPYSEVDRWYDHWQKQHNARLAAQTSQG